MYVLLRAPSLVKQKKRLQTASFLTDDRRTDAKTRANAKRSEARADDSALVASSQPHKFLRHRHWAAAATRVNFKINSKTSVRPSVRRPLLSVELNSFADNVTCRVNL